MQIPNNPFSFAPGFLGRSQPGARHQVNDELQVKANAPDAQEAARPARPAAESAGGAAGLAGANTLAEAVRALRADGRLPPRGSLVDRSA